MFEEFVDRAIHAVNLAYYEAGRYNHNYINPEHLLLGLVEDLHGVAAQVFIAKGLDLGRAKMELEKILESCPEKPNLTDKLSVKSRLSNTIINAREYAKLLRCNYVNTEHLGYALFLEDEEEVVRKILKSVGISKTDYESDLKENHGISAND